MMNKGESLDGHRRSNKTFIA